MPINKKKKKDKNFRPMPKPNRQIPNSMIRAMTAIGIDPVLQQAREYPLHSCWIMAGWEDEGITPVVVARVQESGRIMFAVYMVDFYCLGIKDAFTRTGYSENRFERELPDFCVGSPVKCSVDLAHELIYGALEYAEKLGFQPHADFIRQHADLMLDPKDAHPRVNGVTFGKDGKPFFISGPYDNELRCKQIVNTLMRTSGEGNFEYIVDLGDSFG